MSRVKEFFTNRMVGNHWLLNNIHVSVETSCVSIQTSCSHCQKSMISNSLGNSWSFLSQVVQTAVTDSDETPLVCVWSDPYCQLSHQVCTVPAGTGESLQTAVDIGASFNETTPSYLVQSYLVVWSTLSHQVFTVTGNGERQLRQLILILQLLVY